MTMLRISAYLHLHRFYACMVDFGCTIWIKVGRTDGRMCTYRWTGWFWDGLGWRLIGSLVSFVLFFVFALFCSFFFFFSSFFFLPRYGEKTS